MKSICLAVVGLSITSVVAAETITVCSSGCDHTSIIAAIAAASNGDVIQLSAETYSEGAEIDTLGKAITLRGTVDKKSGAAASILDGGNSHRVLICQSGETASTVFRDLVVAHGSADQGGGMRINGASPSFFNCSFQNNTGHGAYQWAEDCPEFCIKEPHCCEEKWDMECMELVMMYGCSVLPNQYDQYPPMMAGGAIFVRNGNLSFVDCRFENNTLSQPGTGIGAGIMAIQCQLFLDNCSFLENTANPADEDGNYGGGGLCSISTTLDIHNCQFKKNGGNGGGMLTNDCTITMSGTLFEENYAQETWGFGASMVNYESNLNISGCIFKQNTSGSSSGITNFSCNSHISNTTFISNVSGSGPCAIQDTDSVNLETGLVMEGCTFEDNRATGVVCRGAVSLEYSKAVINQCNFLDNKMEQALNGVGIAIHQSGSNAVVNECEFTDNTGTASVISSDQGSLELTSCQVTGSQFGFESKGPGARVVDCLFLSNGFAIEGKNCGWPKVESTIICGAGMPLIKGYWSDEGNNCISHDCEDSDKNGIPDGCDVDPDLELHVPGEYATISDALRVATNGATVHVAEGLYELDSTLMFPAALGVSIRGAVDDFGQPATVLDGSQTCDDSNSRLLFFQSVQFRDSVVENIVFRNTCGWALEIDRSHPTIRNCRFTENSSAVFMRGSAPKFEDCLFDHNANIQEYSYGFTTVAMVYYGDTALFNICGNLNPEFLNCGFENNNHDDFDYQGSLGYSGGAIRAAGYTTMTGCWFYGNTTTSHGGAISFGWGGGVETHALVLNDCEFTENTSVLSGGAVSINAGPSGSNDNTLTMNNCNLYYNDADGDGGALSCLGSGSAALNDTLICGNSESQISGTHTVDSLTCVTEYCEDKCKSDCPEDINSNGLVDAADLGLLLAAWGEAAADINGNGTTDAADLGLLLAAWGPCA